MDDIISRQAAIDALDGEFKITGRENAETIRDYINGVNKKLRELTSAERRGRWEHYEHREPQYDIEGYKTWAEAYKCSNCGFIHTVIEDFGHYAFCPNCGADMRGEQNDQ